MNLGPPEKTDHLRPRAGHTRNSEKFKAATDGVPDSASSLGQAPPGPMMSRPRLFGKPTRSSNVSQGYRGSMDCQFMHEVGPLSNDPCAPAIHQVRQIMGLVTHSALEYHSSGAGPGFPRSCKDQRENVSLGPKGHLVRRERTGRISFIQENSSAIHRKRRVKASKLTFAISRINACSCSFEKWERTPPTRISLTRKSYTGFRRCFARTQGLDDRE